MMLFQGSKPVTKWSRILKKNGILVGFLKTLRNASKYPETVRKLSKQVQNGSNGHKMPSLTVHQGPKRGKKGKKGRKRSKKWHSETKNELLKGQKIVPKSSEIRNLDELVHLKPLFGHFGH
jgi:hypothetical protein